MLALHTLAAIDEGGRTLVFDEVDAGIGGAAADAVGARLQRLGRRDQVISVTHLPQVAAQADAHFQIAKQVQGGRTEALRLTGLLKLFTRATSLGGPESLIEHRASVEGPHTRAPENLLRVSVGLEHPDDLIEDLGQALEQL